MKILVVSDILVSKIPIEIDKGIAALMKQYIESGNTVIIGLEKQEKVSKQIDISRGLKLKEKEKTEKAKTFMLDTYNHYKGNKNMIFVSVDESKDISNRLLKISEITHVEIVGSLQKMYVISDALKIRTLVSDEVVVEINQDLCVSFEKYSLDIGEFIDGLDIQIKRSGLNS